MIQRIFIVNSSGSMLFQAHYGNVKKLNANESIQMASMFYSLAGIAGQISPATDSSYITSLEANNFKVYSFSTLTGLLFVIFADTSQMFLDVLCQRMYEIYSDYVLKNPFYQIDQPIKCDKFDRHLSQLIERVQRGGRI